MAAHILVYDHTPALLAKFSYTLLEAGYEVTTRHPGMISPTQVRALAPDVIVVGYRLHEPAGDTDAIQQLRSDPDLARIPTIIATFDDQDVSLPIPLDGAYHITFTREPFNIDRILAKIAELVGPGDTRDT